MGNHPSNHQPLERGGVGKFGDVNTVGFFLHSLRKYQSLNITQHFLYFLNNQITNLN